MNKQKVIYIGLLRDFDTCTQRMKCLETMGYDIISVDANAYNGKGLSKRIQYNFGIGLQIVKLNNYILNLVMLNQPQILWVDKGTFIKKSTLQKIKAISSAKLVHINPDDPYGKFRRGWRIFNKALPFYDIHFVSRPQNIQEYLERGAKRVYEYDRSFSPFLQKPMRLNIQEKIKYECKVGFVGSYAPERALAIKYLIDNGIEVVIYGNEWQKCAFYKELKPYLRGPVIAEEYAKALSGMNIALHFLRKENRDYQDSRTFEIPACGTFMLAERSYKHEEFFVENEEAVFFDTKEELLCKVRFYLENEELRKIIALSGYKRSINSGYDHLSRLNKMLAIVNEITEY